MQRLQKDNTTFQLKADLRSRLLMMVDNPVVMETHGGSGRLFARCYSHLDVGVVFEKDEAKAEALGRQRPTWAVYEADCVSALAAGAGSHLEVNFLDVDPYGQPWPTIEAFFSSRREFPKRLGIAVNDGFRNAAKMKGSWFTEALIPWVESIGNDAIYENYIAIARELVQKFAGRAGYEIEKWTGYYTGHKDQVSHYSCVLTQG